jgi:CRP/FNR family transcriptional regulator
VADPNLRDDVTRALRECRLWHGASDAAVARLAEAADVRTVPRGALLASEGDSAERFGVVVTGRVRVYHQMADGRTIILESMGAGESFAAVAALAGGRYPASIDAATPATVAWLDRDTLFAVLTAEPDVTRSLVTDLASRLMNLTNVVQTLSLDVAGRLARYLFQRSLATGEATAEGLLVPLGMSKSELAASLGTVPETLSRAFARLRDDGVLEVRANDIIVHDVGALARLGSGYER